jgi:hypothetical protein
VNLYSFLRKKHNKPFLGAFFAVVFLSVFFVTTIKAEAQTPGPRPISDYLTLWGTAPYPQPTNQALKNAEANGIGYFGPLPKEQGGYDDEGILKKIKAPITLVIDQKKFREWNMVAGTYYRGMIDPSLKQYLRLTNQSFVARIYQKDASGNIINLSYAEVPVCSFLTCLNGPNDSVGDSATRKKWAKDGVPSDRIIKFAEPAGTFSNFWNATSDGYAEGGPSGETPLSIGGAAASGAIIGSVIPGVGTTVGAVLGLGINYFANTDGPILVMKQTAIVTLPVNTNLEKGKSAYIDLWYMGLARMTTSDDTFEPAAEPAQIKADPQYGKRIQYFNIPLEDGRDNQRFPFFQIGETREFKTPESGEVASTQAQSAEEEISTFTNNLETNKEDSFLPACDIMNGWRLVGDANGTFMGCIAQFTYYMIYRPVAWFAGLMGELFDFFLGYSLSDSSYRQPFIVDGWKLVRDISNIFFIIILIWTGLATVFNMDGISMKKIVPALIINALLINFSLFGTQVIIDISNITARIFYNSTQVCTGECKDENPKDGTPDNLLESSTGYKSLSVAITSGFNPQRLFSTDVINSAKSTPPRGGNAALDEGSNSNDEGVKKASSGTEQAGYFIIVCLIASLIMFAVAKMFWGTAFMFLGRIIGLYIVMIFSPFAVVTRGNMPLISKIPELSWSNWIKDLTSYALLAPIFVFFLYIISAFVQSGFMETAINSTGDTFFEKVLRTAIPMLIVYFMLRQGVGIAKNYAGKMGELVQNSASKFAGIGAGVAVGVASGGTALLGRGAMSFANKVGGTWAATNKDAGGLKGMLAGGTNRFLKWGNKTSFDVRNTALGKNVTGGLGAGVLGSMGIKLQDNVSGSIGLGEKDYLGGNVKARKKAKDDKEKRIEEKTDMSHLTDTQAQKVWENRSKKMNEHRAEVIWEESRVAELESGKHAISGGLTEEKAAELKGKREEAQVLVKELEVAITSGNKDQQKIVNEKLNKNAEDQKALTVPLMAVLANEKKGDKHKEEKDGIYDKALKQAQSETKNKYGDVKSAKDLSEVNRYEYQKRMLEDSLLLSKDKKRAGLWALGAGIFSNYIDSQQQMELEVMKKGIDAFEKKHNKKDNRVLKLKADLQEIDDLINSHIDKTLSDGRKATQLDDNERVTYLNIAKENAERELREKEDKYKASKAVYEAKKPEDRTEEDHKNHNKAVDDYYRAMDSLDALRNANKNRAKKEDDLERAKAEEDRKSGDKKKKEDDGGDKKKKEE